MFQFHLCFTCCISGGSLFQICCNFGGTLLQLWRNFVADLFPLQSLTSKVSHSIFFSSFSKILWFSLSLPPVRPVSPPLPLPVSVSLSLPLSFSLSYSQFLSFSTSLPLLFRTETGRVCEYIYAYMHACMFVCLLVTRETQCGPFFWI